MPKYEVEVLKITYGVRSFEIEAEDEEKAQDLAMKMAQNYDFADSFSEFEINNHEPMELNHADH